MSPQLTKRSKVGKPRSTAKNPNGTRGRKKTVKKEDTESTNGTTADKKQKGNKG